MRVAGDRLYTLVERAEIGDHRSSSNSGKRRWSFRSKAWLGAMAGTSYRFDNRFRYLMTTVP